jgi:DNA polymerase I-like protein with 3'-5' exonuclease and polymerase domains
LEGGLSDLAKEISKEALRTVLDLFKLVLTPQEQKSKRLEEIQFADALSVVSFIGPSIASQLQKDAGQNDQNTSWGEIRKRAKAVGFGYLYGMWWKKFKRYARDNYGIIVTDQEAQESRKSFFELYSGFVQWHERQRRFARNNGYVRSLAGRKRRLPKAQLRDDTPERREAERQAINSPVQSFASDLNIMSALQLHKEYTRDKVRIVGSVHDSLLIYVRKPYVVEVANRIQEIMRWPKLLDVFQIEFTVPLESEVKIGPWSKGISLEKWRKANGL